MNSRDSRNTERAILDAVIECKYEFKLAPIQMTQVAARAGVSTRTLYRYYPDKNELLYSAAARFLQREYDVFASHYAALDKTGMNGLERLVLLLRTQRNYYSSDQIKSLLFSHANSFYDFCVSGQRNAQGVMSERIQSIAASCIADGISDGSIRDSLDFAAICSMVVAGMDGMMRYLTHINRAGTESVGAGEPDAVFESYIEMLSMYLGGEQITI